MTKLTEDVVQGLFCPVGKRDELFFDDQLPGFGVRAYSSGKKSFFVKYSMGAKQRKMSLGPVCRGALAQTRRKAQDVLARARMGQDVQGERQAERDNIAYLFADLIDPYLDARRQKFTPAYHATVGVYLNRQWKPLHNVAIEQVTRKQINAILNGIAKKSPSTADHAKSVLSAFYAWAIVHDFLDHSPVMHIERRGTKGARDRVLSEAELVAVWNAAENFGDYGKIIRLLILTGTRRAEIADLTWPEVNLTGAQITLPAERTKNKLKHVVPLADAALDVLKDVPHRNSTEFLFGKGSRGYQDWSKSKVRLDARLPKDMKPWTLHDLRRSFVTHVNEKGFAMPHVIESCCNHVSGHKAGICGIYNHAQYLPEKIAAMDRWGSHITTLIMRA